MAMPSRDVFHNNKPDTCAAAVSFRGSGDDCVNNTYLVACFIFGMPGRSLARGGLMKPEEARNIPNDIQVLCGNSGPMSRT